LRVRPFSVGGIAESLGIRQPQVSKHLSVLREAGVVAVEPVGRRRIYHLRGEAFEEIRSWVDSFESLWEARLDSLETFLNSTEEARSLVVPAGRPGMPRKGSR
jgi:DNA-binding transcriptional ArsR family regulator